MKLRILLINPWIYDFAAYNLWSMPLGLLKVAEYLSSYDTELSLIDCTDSCASKKYGDGKFNSETVEKPSLLKNIPRHYKRYGISPEEFRGKLKAALPADIVMITSVMSYWYPGVQKAVEFVRQAAGNAPIVLGGIYPTLYHEHAVENSGADFIYRGGVNERLNFALYTFGFRLKRKREQVKYYRLNLYEKYRFAPLMTSTGCPFMCSYCASSLLTGGYARMTNSDVIKEIKELYDSNIRDFAFYDDALLVDSGSHIKPVLREISGSRPGINFHAPNGLHASFIDEELAYLMKASNFKTIRLSLETVDAERQKKTGGKVDITGFGRAVFHLKNAGFAKKEIGAYLMYGLPGQDIVEVKDGIAFLKSLGVRINLTEFSPIRHTALWDEMVKAGIISGSLDPLLTNNSVFSYLYSSYDSEDVGKMKLDVKEYNAQQLA